MDFLKDVVEYMTPVKTAKPKFSWVEKAENSNKAELAETTFGIKFNQAYELDCRGDPGDKEEAWKIYDDLFWNEAYTPLHTSTNSPDFIDRLEVIKKTYGEPTAHFLLAVNALSYDFENDDEQKLLIKTAIAHSSKAVLVSNDFKPAWDLLLHLAPYNTAENNFNLSRLCLAAEPSMFYQEKIQQLMSAAASQGYQLAIDEMDAGSCAFVEYSSSEEI